MPSFVSSGCISPKFFYRCGVHKLFAFICVTYLNIIFLYKYYRYYFIIYFT